MKQIIKGHLFNIELIERSRKNIISFNLRLIQLDYNDECTDLIK